MEIRFCALEGTVLTSVVSVSTTTTYMLSSNVAILPYCAYRNIKPAMIVGPAVRTILAVTGLVAVQPSQSAALVLLHSSSDHTADCPSTLTAIILLSYSLLRLFPTFNTNSCSRCDWSYILGIPAVHSARQF